MCLLFQLFSSYPLFAAWFLLSFLSLIIINFIFLVLLIYIASILVCWASILFVWKRWIKVFIFSFLLIVFSHIILLIDVDTLIRSWLYDLFIGRRIGCGDSWAFCKSLAKSYLNLFTFYWCGLVIDVIDIFIWVLGRCCIHFQQSLREYKLIEVNESLGKGHILRNILKRHIFSLFFLH
jgi:hypothetical protein